MNIYTGTGSRNLVLRVESSRDVGDDDLPHPQQLHHPHGEHGLGGDRGMYYLSLRAQITGHLGQREALVGVAPPRADDHVARPLAAQHQLPLVARQLGAGVVRDGGIGDAGDHLLHSQAQNTCKYSLFLSMCNNNGKTYSAPCRKSHPLLD